jgi:hypothetical protein
LETTTPVAVENIKIGDRIDLASCRFLKNHPTADFQYAEVSHFERETEDCVVIGYEGIGWIGYRLGTILQAKPLADVPDPVAKVRPVATPSKFIDWRISQNLTDRWGEINNHNEAEKPLELLVGTPGLLDRLREQMWDEICFVARRDGQFGILFEVEYVSYESDSADHDPEFTEELKPICEMFKIIADAAMEKLVSKFPGVEIAIPDEGMIVQGRPALWAWVPDGLLTAEQREDLGTLMLNL